MRISDSIEDAISVLRRGGAIVYPTDTVLGLGVNALNEEALRLLYKIKKRPLERPVPVIISSIKIAKKLAHINEKQEKILESVWPGAVTVVLESKAGGTIGLRIPDHPVPIQLSQEFPITGTSANITGEPSCQYIHEVQSQFHGQLPQPDLLLDMPAQNKSGPSTVVDITTPEAPKILRVGACSPKQLLELLRV